VIQRKYGADRLTAGRAFDQGKYLETECSQTLKEMCCRDGRIAAPSSVRFRPNNLTSCVPARERVVRDPGAFVPMRRVRLTIARANAFAPHIDECRIYDQFI
jgi:hypothetical protein